MSTIPFKHPFKKRSIDPQEALRSKFESAVYTITGHFFETAIFKHSLTKGEERENPLIKFLTDNLPKTYSVVKGEVVDINNSSSTQLDIMIYDNSRSIPFYIGDHCILPAEALLASIEVKSKLTQEETRKILKSVKILKSLKPFGKALDLSIRKRQNDDKVKCRYFHSVFAYETDLKEADWAKSEFERIKRLASEEKIDLTLIDRIFVLNRGLINVTNAVGKETKDNAESFLYFYMNLLNYIQRENARRQTVPYLDYAGRLSNGWEHL